MIRPLVRALYTRISSNSLVARARTHPRVRSFARRRVSILLAGSPTWANVDGALRLLGEDRTQPIVFGPWEGDETTELLYWAPFVRWAQEHFALERLAAVSRHDWYGVRRFDSIEAATRELPGAAVFPSAAVRALVDVYRSGDGPLRPLMKRARHLGLGGRAEGVVTNYGAAALEAALRGAPVIALRPQDAGPPEADLDLAVRVVSSLGGTFVVLDHERLSQLRTRLRAR